MASQKRRKLENTVAALQERYGAQAVRRANELKVAVPPAVPSGFPTLDQLTGCQGLPLGSMTILSGPPTSGKLTVAYKALVNAQAQGAVLILDLHQNCDPDYLARCGVKLETLYIVRPELPQTVPLLLDLVQTGEVRLILVDSLPDLLTSQSASRALHAALDPLHNLLRGTGCALVWIDEAEALWQRWLSDSRRVRQHAALQLELRRERWLYRGDTLVGYRSVVQLQKSQWAGAARSAMIEVIFNGREVESFAV